MRINKAILLGGVSALLASQALTLPTFAPRAEAMSPEALNARASESRVVAKSKAASRIQEIDNSGRKLALSIPGLGTAHISLTPATTTQAATVSKKAQRGNADKAPAAFPYGISHKGNNITVKVPETVDEALDYGHVAAKQAGKVASAAITQIGGMTHWIGMYIKQLTHSTTVTPASYPYISQQTAQTPTQIAAAQKLYRTTDGRLRTVVSR